MENLDAVKKRFQSLADKIDQLIDEEAKSLPNGVEVGTIGKPNLSIGRREIPKGEHVGFIFAINKSEVNPEFYE